MGPVEALEIALKLEKEAVETYKGFYAKFPESKETFLFLMNEEVKHRIFIEKEIQRLTKY